KIPAAPGRDPRADLWPGLDQALGLERLDRLAQDRARDPVALHHYRVAVQNRANWGGARDNGPADFVDDESVEIARSMPPREGSDKAAGFDHIRLSGTLCLRGLPPRRSSAAAR